MATHHTVTADQMAFDLLLRGAPQHELTALSRKINKVMANEVTCPECGDEGPHEDNGAFGYDLAFCCRKCGAHFDACPF